MVNPGRSVIGREPPIQGISRFAPSPTGALHLGNARTFVINAVLARKFNWNMVLRIEDLDGPRVKPEAAAGIQSTLRWLGLAWKGSPLVQSGDLEPYRVAMQALADRGLAYPSSATRGDLEADGASAPQEGSHEVRFGAERRPADVGPRAFDPEDGVAWRFVVPEVAGGVEVRDEVARPRVRGVDVAGQVGDFVVWTKRGTPSYQLAVVVDDARQGVTDVVRGRDLLDSAARQTLLYGALGLGATPRYWHLSVVVGPDGRRLAKRHGDARVETYRARGVPAEAILGWIGWSAGVLATPQRTSFEDLCAAWPADWANTAPEPDRLTLNPEDEQWLQSHAGKR